MKRIKYAFFVITIVAITFMFYYFAISGPWDKVKHIDTKYISLIAVMASLITIETQIVCYFLWTAFDD